METRANYVVVGALLLAGIAGAFGFSWWLLRGAGIGQRAEVTILFPVAVDGLAVGKPVTFNGIRIGEVTRLNFSARDPNLVVAIASVDRKAPLKTDTAASLRPIGLTGGALIALSGGSADAPPLIGGEAPAVILAGRSEFQDIVDAARGLIVRADAALQTIEALVRDNGPGIGRVVRNAETLTDALAKRAGDVDAIIADAREIAASLKAAAARADAALGRVDDLLTSEEGEGLLAEATLAARAFRAAAQGFEQRAGEIAAAIDRIGAKGLRDIESFVNDGRRTLQAMERVAAELERDPKRLLFGGDRTPDYAPNRR